MKDKKRVRTASQVKRQKEYYGENKEQILKKQKSYWEKYKDRINMQRKKKREEDKKERENIDRERRRLEKEKEERNKENKEIAAAREIIRNKYGKKKKKTDKPPPKEKLKKIRRSDEIEWKNDFKIFENHPFHYFNSLLIRPKKYDWIKWMKNPLK